MKIYDSLTQKNKELPDDKKITIYNCGPTVYNDVHIGNIRPMITFDILCRFLRQQKYKVFYMHNLTDIDDKIIKKAQEQNKSEKQISEFYSNAYLKLMHQLGVSKPNMMPKVSENIKDIIKYVDRLVQKKKAYITDEGDVYFDINSVKDSYGSLSKQKISELLKGVRKANKDDKHNPLDFVLWKKTEEGLNWKSPWNKHGRPGWHTECATFINKYVGDTVVIHGGGIDLIFPHHENENAQNIALTGKGLADIWMHVGHINVNNVKMSKSLNNFIIAKELLKKFDPSTIKWFILQTSYKNPLNFSNDLLKQADVNIKKIFKQLNYGFIQLKLNNKRFVKNKSIAKEFIDAMDDNLNFPNAIAVIESQIKSLSAHFKNKTFTKLSKTLNEIINELEILGIKYKFSLTDSEIIKVNMWRRSLKEKKYQITDSIRKYFEEKGKI